MCIPTHDRAGKVKIASRPPLEGLEGFDPKMNYQGEKRSDLLLDPEYLICTVKRTHDAIHYGDDSILWSDPVERSRNDTCPWKK